MNGAPRSLRYACHWYLPRTPAIFPSAAWRNRSLATRARASAEDRRTQFRNRYLMMAKNDSLRDLLRDAGPLLLYEVLALGYAVLREPELLRGYLEAAGRLPGALARRRVIQSRRQVRRLPFGMEPPA